MKILFFNYEFPPLGGGAGNASFYMLREYAKMPGVEVDFVTSSIDEQYQELKMGENITIHRLPIGKNNTNIHFQSQKDLLKYSWVAYKFSKQLVKKNNYDLTHSFFSVPCGYLSLRLWKKYKIPYIVSLRGSDVPGYSERFKAIYGLLTPIILKVWNNAEFVIANSEGFKELALKSKPKKEIGVICNGIDTHEFYPDESARNEKEIAIICTSRITPRKGIRLLVQAFDILSKRYDNLKLVLVGGGDEKESLENLVRSMGIEKKVQFCGVVPHEEIAAYYRKANVFVLPSFNEGMSNTMLEAVASGLPILATDTGGTRELVEEGKNGFILKMGDYNDIAEKLEKLIQDPDLRNKMGAESRKRAEKMSWENVAKEYVDLYQQTINLRKIREGK
ncbi:MAG TPA: glycosyltransferase family 4 protein [Patescibacteria group bacterium]